jgi:hypothetical protein
MGISHTLGHGEKQLHSLDLSWFYTWSARPPSFPTSVDFVPMIWGSGSMRRNEVEEVMSETDKTRAAELLGFNEPDHDKQADMSVDEAVRYWPQLEQSGLRLGAPAPARALGDWLKRFMEQAATKDLRVDFMTMHSYTSPNAESFLNRVQRMHDLYEKPIWVTEYAVADWNASASSPSRYKESEIMKFMQETVAGLREMPFVERYAWKTREHGDPVMGASAIFDSSGSLSATGELYRSL